MRPAEHHGLSVRTEAEIQEILRHLREGLEDLYGERLRGLYLFGSYARGEADAESDVDVLVVLDEIEQRFDEATRVSGLASDISLAADVSVSCVLVAERRWRNGDSTFLDNVREEAIAV
ncbi:nucleotidyltransferase domain-containing protein [soil metagenome]